MSILFALGPGPAPRPLEPSYLSPGPSSNALVRLLCQPMPGEPGSLLPPHPILHTPFFSSSQASRWGCVLGSYENMYRLKGQAGTELAPPRDVSAQGLLPVLPGSIQENNSEQEINPKTQVSCLDRMLGSQSGGWGVRQSVTGGSERATKVPQSPGRLEASWEVGQPVFPFCGHFHWWPTHLPGWAFILQRVTCSRDDHYEVLGRNVPTGLKV